MEKIQIKSIILFFLAVIFLSNCTNSGSNLTLEEKQSNLDTNNNLNNAKLSDISDIPIPANSIIDDEKTLIIGKNDEWMGRISITSSSNVDEIYDFFHKEMINFSFEKKTSEKSIISTLIYENNRKAIFIKISKLKSGKTYIEITATPVN